MTARTDHAGTPPGPPLLTAEGLCARYPGADRPAVTGADFTIGHDRLGLVGESGSGKSTIARVLLGLMPPGSVITAGTLTFAGTDLTRARAHAWRSLRGRRIGLVPQDARQSLDPVRRIGAQMDEVLRLHRGLKGRAAREAGLDLLARCGLPDPRTVADAWPHMLSGGMAQRVTLALALAGEPELLIADEATSALDVTVRNRVLDLLDDVAAERRLGLLLVTHDLDLAAGFCDRVAVLWRGRTVEHCAARDLRRARHPYTRGLLAARPGFSGYERPLPTLDRAALAAAGGNGADTP